MANDDFDYEALNFTPINETEERLWTEFAAHDDRIWDDAIVQTLFHEGFFAEADVDTHNMFREAFAGYIDEYYDIDIADAFDWNEWREWYESA